MSRTPTQPRSLLVILILLTVGCNSRAPLTDGGKQPISNHQRRESRERGQPGAFDYYVLALSWSPEFCHSNSGGPECGGHYGFVVHGLWPQSVDSYPENCSTEPGLADPASMGDIMPDPGLVAHEWKAHGTCSGLDPEAYFKLVRQAYASVKIPRALTAPHRGFTITPKNVKEDFIRSNTQLKEEDLSVSCGNNWLTGVSVCLDKQLHPHACEALRDCRANSIRVAPVR